MSKLLIYGVFHANLNFSYIAPDLFPQILQRCYWPLLELVEDQEIPLGLEFNAYTLELVHSLDPSFTKRLGKVWDQGDCEVVGSGYVQSIMPLMPAHVNRENLRVGNQVYERLLGRPPTVAYVNEQVYSASLPNHYAAAGYETILVNWDSAAHLHSQEELLYQPCSVPVDGKGTMSLLWHCTTAYRNFQQYVEKEIPLETYMDRLSQHIPASGERSYPIYSSDWEVFDFKPWQVFPDGFRQPDRGEMDRVSGLLSQLKTRPDMEFVCPSDLVARLSEQPMVHPESSETPLTYKKQDQHGILRWAVGGRDSTRFNTQCHQLYQKLQLAQWLVECAEYSANLPETKILMQGLWKELCFLWASDFRTFTTEEKHLQFRNSMGAALASADAICDSLQLLPIENGQVILTNCSPVATDRELMSFNYSPNGDDKDNVAGYDLQINGQRVPCQVTAESLSGVGANRLTLAASPAISAASSETGIIKPRIDYQGSGPSAVKIDPIENVIETDSIRIQLAPENGGAIKELTFSAVSSKPLLIQPSTGTYPGDLVDAFSGNFAIDDLTGRKVYGRSESTMEFPEINRKFESFVPVRCFSQTELGSVWKTYRVYINQPRVDLTIRFQLKDVVPRSFRLGHVVLNPAAFDGTSLRYATNHGGDQAEIHSLAGFQVNQGLAKSSNVSATSCLGATEGWVTLGDGSSGVGIVTRHAVLYSVPMLHYQKDESSQNEFFLGLTHSLGEQDETAHTLWRGHSTWEMSILGGTDDLNAKTRDAALLANGGLIPRWSVNTSESH